MNITTISLTGPDGVGKSTAARLLCELLGEYSRNSKVVGFGAYIYQEVSAAFGVPEDLLRDQGQKNTPIKALALALCRRPEFMDAVERHFHGGTREGGIEGERINLDLPRSPRQILRWWATEYRRRQNPMYWVDRYASDFDSWRSWGCFPIAQDLRDKHEADFTRSVGGQVWAVTSFERGTKVIEHSTQVTGREFDPEVTICNSGSLPNLRAQLHRQLHLQGLLPRSP